VAKLCTENPHGAVVLQFRPQPHRVEVQISARDGRGPIGRTRPLKLTECDFARLVDVAQQMEAAR
jgi:hypothetical protein